MTGLGTLTRTVAGTTLDSVPIVGDAIEIFDAVKDVREKGVMNTGIRVGLGLVPNGPWTSWAEGGARAMSGGRDGWEATVANWVTGGKDKAPKNPNEVDLSKSERKQAAEMAKDTVKALKDGDNIQKVIAKEMKNLEKIKDPEKRAAMMMAYSQLLEIEVNLTIGEDGIISQKEREMARQVEAIKVQFDAGVKSNVPGASGVANAAKHSGWFLGN